MTAYPLIILLAVLLSAFLYHRSQPAQPKSRIWLLAILRGITLSILLLFIFSPIIRYIQNQVQRQQVILLTDTSRSMHNDGKAAWMKDKAKTLEERYKKAGYKVIKHPFASGLEGSAEDTQLAPALKELASRYDLSRVQSLLLFSDGWLRDEDLSIVRQLGVPLSPIADSSSTLQMDLAVENLRNNRHGYRGEPNLFRATISSKNYSGPATVTLKSKGGTLATRTIQLSADDSQEVEFTHRFPTLGFHPLRVEVSAPNLREKELSNNHFPGAIDILAEKERIIVISDKAGWDNKFIIDAIATNSRWQSQSFILQDAQIRIGERNVADFGTARPAAIVVVNNGELKPDTRLLALLRNAQKSGGGILWQGMPLSELSDVLALAPSNVASSFQGFLAVKPAAQAWPLLDIDSSELKNIPPLSYYFLKAQPGAQILASIDSHQEPPAIAIKTGVGRVVNFAFLDFWRWQLQSPASTYQQTITNILTWLSNQSGGSYRAIYDNSYFQHEQINIRLRAEDDIRQSRLDLNPRLLIKDASGKEVFSDYMQRQEEDYGAHLSLDKPGEYSFSISESGGKGSINGSFNVEAGSLEERDFHYNLPLLNWLANESGGRMMNQGQIEDYQPPTPQNRQLTVTQEIPLYRKWYIIALFLLSFGVELFLRRRWGLL